MNNSKTKRKMSPEKELIFEDLLDELFSHSEDPITARHALKEKAATDEDFKMKLEHYMKVNNMQTCSEVLPDYMFAIEVSDVEDETCWETTGKEGDKQNLNIIAN